MVNPARSIDIATHAFNCALDEARLLSTPEEELALAMEPPPSPIRWLNPELTAIYVLANGANGLLKIGMAENLKNRIVGLDCGSPVPLYLRHFIFFVGRTVTKYVEGEVHRTLAESRVKGEWFDVSLETAAQTIAETARRRKLMWWTERERRELGTKASKEHIIRLKLAGTASGY